MKKSLKEKSYDYIKEKIITCVYIPGDFLDEKQLINEIGASRTPIREALNKLELEGLLQILPKKGVVVTDINLKTIVDLYQCRLLIEVNSLNLFIDKIDFEIIKKLKEEVKNIKNIDDLNKHDDDLHEYFISLYDNQYIDNVIENMNTQNKRIRILTTNSSSSCLKSTIEEHNIILDAILEKDFEKAKQSLEEHILKSKERTVNSILKTM